MFEVREPDIVYGLCRFVVFCRRAVVVASIAARPVRHELGDSHNRARGRRRPHRQLARYPSTCGSPVTSRPNGTNHHYRRALIFRNRWGRQSVEEVQQILSPLLLAPVLSAFSLPSFAPKFRASRTWNTPVTAGDIIKYPTKHSDEPI